MSALGLALGVPFAAVLGAFGGQSFPPFALQAFHTRASNAWYLDPSQGANLFVQSVLPGSGPAGTLPTGWSNTGVQGSLPDAVAQETVNGSATGVVKIRRVGATGLEGLQQNFAYPNFPAVIGMWVRVPTGVTPTDVLLYGGVGVSTIVSNATLQAQPKDSWVFYSLAFTYNAGDTVTAIGLGNAAAGTGVDIAMPRLSLGTTVEPYRATTTTALTRLTQYANNVLRVVTAPDGASAALREPSSTNLLLRSEDLSLVWAASGTEPPTFAQNVAIAPDGTATADSVTRPASVVTNCYASQALIPVAGTYSYSQFFKLGSSGQFVGMRISATFPNRVDALFDLLNGVVVGTAATGTASAPVARMEYMRDGWYRCTVTGTVAGAVDQVLFSPTNTSASISTFEGATTGTSQVFVWGGQLEAYQFPTSYIPTAAATVARSRDEILDTVTLGAGSPFGVFMDCCIPYYASGVNRLTGGNGVGVGVYNTGRSDLWNGTTDMINTNSSQIPGARTRIAWTCDGTGRAGSMNGGAVISDANQSTAITAGTYYLGQLSAAADGSSGPLYIHEYRRAFRRWSNAQLIAMTDLVSAMETRWSGTTLNTAPLIVGRTGSAWAFDATGVLQSIAAGVLRYGKAPSGAMGILVEDSSTNAVRNSSALGGTTGGVLGAAGNPTFWSMEQQYGSNVTPTNMGSGTEYGMPYVDVGITGTPSNSNHFLLNVDTGLPAASVGASMVGSYYWRLVSGNPGVSSTFCSLEALDAGGVSLTSGTVGGSSGVGTPAVSTGTGYPQRQWATIAVTPGSTAKVRMRISVPPNATGSPVDFVIRIYLPQIEYASYPSSPIITTNATVTRNADDIRLPFDTYLGRDQGTMFCAIEQPFVTLMQGRSEALYVQDSGLNRLALRAGDGSLTNSPLLVVGDGVGNVNIGPALASNSLRNRLVGTWNRTTALCGRNGTTASATKTWAHGGAAVSQIGIGSGLGTLAIGGYITDLALSKTAVPVETVASITA